MSNPQAGVTYSASYHKRLSYSPYPTREGGCFFLGSSQPIIRIRDGIIYIGCKEITFEAFDALARELAEYRNPSCRERVVQS